MKNGDLHKDGYACGLEYEHGYAQKLEGLIDLTLDVIEVFGEAGLRALINRAERHADELDLFVRAKLATDGEEKMLAQAKLSEFDKKSLCQALLDV